MVYKLCLVASPQIGLPSQGYEQGNQLGGCWKKTMGDMWHGPQWWHGSGLSFLNSIGNSIGNFKDKLA